MAYHGLIPERVETVTSVTPKRDKNFKTPLGQFNYRYLAIEKYPHEIEQVWMDRTHPVLIASPEKALCDTIVLNKVAELTFIDEARQFLAEDLRIDQMKWKHFDPIKLRLLNTFYRNKSIACIQEAL